MFIVCFWFWSKIPQMRALNEYLCILNYLQMLNDNYNWKNLCYVSFQTFHLLVYRVN